MLLLLTRAKLREHWDAFARVDIYTYYLFLYILPSPFPAGSHNNVWESSVENADKLAQTFGLGDKLKAKGPQQLSHLAPMVMTQTNFRQDCRGGDCHFD
mmetsp:Transcript_76750/g.206852  ORF Transcript_76750/g.206852 Transcript_76750/m.206852 type:complete len:99 (+) Transcript_76750:239-535(+)